MLAPPAREPRSIDENHPEAPKPLIDNPFKDDPVPAPAAPLGFRTFKKPVQTVSHEESASKTKGYKYDNAKDATDELYSLSNPGQSKGVTPASYQPSVRMAKPPKNPLR